MGKEELFGIFADDYGGEFYAWGTTAEEVLETLSEVSGKKNIQPEAVKWYAARELQLKPRSKIEFL